MAVRLAAAAAAQWPLERPDSALSNLSELDSGYDELRSFTVTPVIPPELVITGPPQDDLLPPDVTSASSVDHHDEREHGDEDNNKSTSSDLGPTETFPAEDRYNTSSLIDQEDLLSVNTGTGNTSAVSLTSLDAAADSYRRSADNSECKSPPEYYTVALN